MEICVEINCTDAHNFINFMETKARIKSYLAPFSPNNHHALFVIPNLLKKIAKTERWNLFKTAVKTLAGTSYTKTTFVLIYSFRCLLSPPREGNVLCV